MMCECYRVTLKKPVDDIFNGESYMQTVMKRVDEFNNIQHYLFFNGCRSDGTMEFFYVSNIFRKQSIAMDEAQSNISEMFGVCVELSEINAAELDEVQQKKLCMAKRLAESFADYEAEFTTRWCLKSRADVLAEVDELIGFDTFKEFFGKLDTYIANVQKLGCRGNFNVAIIKTCSVDENVFFGYIYELYAACGILTDCVMGYGDLGEAARSERNTPHMFNIEMCWHEERAANTVFRASIDKKLQKLIGKETIYVTSMNKKQYDTMDVCSFKSVFAHSVELRELTSGEKLLLLAKEAEAYGFQLRQGEFESSELLKLPLNELRTRLTGAMSGRLYEHEMLSTLLSPADFGEAKKEVGKKALDELEKLVGLETVKSCVKQLAVFLERRGKNAVPCLHMVFRGNPGTGKTTVARLIGRIFGELGILEHSELFVETDREGLVGMYVGHTAAKTAGKINEAMGGVLFIDEAYSLAQKDSFGKEAIATLVKRMEDRRQDFVCIMAGYTHEMDKFLSVNPGLRERVQFYIDFPDYSADELLTIFKMYCSESGYELSPDADLCLQGKFAQIVRNKDEDFANARLARKLYERVILKQALRSTDDIITSADIEAVFEDTDISRLEDIHELRKIGF